MSTVVVSCLLVSILCLVSFNSSILVGARDIGVINKNVVHDVKQKLDTLKIGDKEKVKVHEVRHEDEGKMMVNNQSKPKFVTWRVPEENKGVHDERPLYDLDYAPPKLHPPTHN